MKNSPRLFKMVLEPMTFLIQATMIQVRNVKTFPKNVQKILKMYLLKYVMYGSVREELAKTFKDGALTNGVFDLGKNDLGKKLTLKFCR